MYSFYSILKILSWALLIIFTGCNKKEFLEANPRSELVTPSTLEDCQALLDNESAMSETPSLGEISADNYYLPYNFWRGLNLGEKNAHVWQADTFEGLIGNIPDWNVPYKQVFTANVILKALTDISVTSNNEQSWNSIKGAALFARAHGYYQIAQLFSPVYTKGNATQYGIPIKLSPNVDEPTVRSTVADTYEQILFDLREASALLPRDIPYLNRNRSSRPAAFALLARVHLFMGEFQKARDNADSCLLLYNKLIKYDTIKAAENRNPFNNLNAETIFQSRFISTTNVLKAFSVSNCIVDSGLYRSYESNDLRKEIFFRKHPTLGNINPRGSYNGTNQLFTGIATDEVYLIRAECQARLGNAQNAMDDLNALLVNRWKGMFTPKTATSAKAALDTILNERRKELPFRGLRWSDIRRLNQNGDAQIDLKRRMNGEEYTLLHGDPRFTLLIPPDVISLSGIPQNPR